MNIREKGKIILGINILDGNYEMILSFLESAISLNDKKTITYINFNTLNYAIQNESFHKMLNKFDLKHADGIGVFVASKILYGRKGLKNRMTGSDFYPFLVKKILEKNWKVYILGDTCHTLERIKQLNPALRIVGMTAGFNYSTSMILEELKKNKPEILLVGLGTPFQEEWVMNNLTEISANIIIAVGEGLKILSNTKVRGPLFFRKIGLEWAIRLLNNPRKFWRRYLKGGPLFLLKIFQEKLNSNGSS